MSVLFYDLLDLFHFLVEHLEQLGVLLILDSQLLNLVLALKDLGFQGGILSY